MPFSITAIWGNHRKERVKPEPFYGKCPVVMLKNVFYASRTLCQMAIMPNNFKQNSWAQMPQHGCPSVGWHMSKRHKESILLGVKPLSIMAIRHNVIKKKRLTMSTRCYAKWYYAKHYSRRGAWVIRHKPQQSKGNLCNLAYRTFGITRRVYFGYAEWPYPRFHE